MAWFEQTALQVKPVAELRTMDTPLAGVGVGVAGTDVGVFVTELVGVGVDVTAPVGVGVSVTPLP